MNMLANLTSDATIAQETDSVGGNAPLESGLYPMTVAMAHLNKSDGGALSLVLTLKDTNGKEVKQALWMTSGTAKGGNNYYIDKNGDKQYLPGYLQANSLCQLTLGKEISAMVTEEKVIKLYNATAKAEVPTKVQVLTDLIGQDILVGLIKQTVDKTTKNDQGVYLPTGETRDENEIDKLFRAADRMTSAEIRAQATEASFAATWEAKWAGKTKNKSKGADANGGTAGAPRAASAPGAGNKPKASLFA